MPNKFAIIGDFNTESKSHQATNAAIEHSGRQLNTNVHYDWIATDDIKKRFDKIIQDYRAFWFAPGGPYKDLENVLRLIEHARLNNLSVLGTCGGFQLMVIEFARNVLHIHDADHAEYNPKAPKLVIQSLACVIRGQTLHLKILDKASHVYKIYGQDEIQEKYYCNFGLNFEYRDLIDKQGFQVVGVDKDGEARILELKDRKFYIATLFVPQVSSTKEHPHPLITAFLKQLS